jgi:hypothetical protein
MKVKMILPALTESESPFWRPIKYSLFPPLGLATLAAYLSPDDEIAQQLNKPTKNIKKIINRRRRKISELIST